MKKTTFYLLTIIITILIAVKCYGRTLGFYGFTDESTSITLQQSAEKNNLKDSEKAYCLELLKQFESIVSTKDYDSLTEEEKKTVKEFLLAFSQTWFCASKLWNDYTKKSDLNPNKLPENKLFILTTSWKVNKGQPVDVLSVIDRIIPECSNAVSPSQKIKCTVSSGTLIDRGIAIPTYVIPLLVKVKNPDKVDLLVYEMSSPISIKKYGEQLEKVKKNPGNKALCIYGLDVTRPFSHSLKITCPFLHLEKDFSRSFLSCSHSSPILSLFVIYTPETPKHYQNDSSFSEDKQICNEPVLKQAISELTGEGNVKRLSRASELKEWLKKTGQISTENYCLVKVRKIQIDGLPFYITYTPESDECIDEIIKHYYKNIREQYMWLKKELKPRGYID